MGIPINPVEKSEQSRKLAIEPESELQREVEQIRRDLHEQSVKLLTIGNRLAHVASEYEKLLNDLRDSSGTSKADSSSIRESDSAKQNSETIEARCEALVKKVSTLMMKRSNNFVKDSPKD